MKKITAFLLAAVTAFSAVSCGKNKSSGTSSETEAQASAKSSEDTGKINMDDYLTSESPTPAMWKVTDPDTGNELYLLGTIHIVTENTFPLPDYVMDVYENCEAIAVEYDTSTLTSDLSLMQDFLRPMLYTDGTTIKDHISEENYNSAKEFLRKHRSYNSLLDNYSPGFWISQIETLSVMQLDGLSTDGVDATFISKAAEDGKEVISIETLDAQVNAITGYSDELADYVLSEYTEIFDDSTMIAEEFAATYNNWASGDVDALAEDEADDSEDLPEELEDDYEDYMNAMLYDRNEGMAERAEEFLKEGKNYFFMVGAMHFAGDRGVDDLLAEKGYKVEELYGGTENE